MELYIFIICISVCSLTLFLCSYYKFNKPSINSNLLEIIVVIAYISSAELLSATKSSFAFIDSFSIALLKIGLLCILLSNFFQNIKRNYPFHDKNLTITSSLLSLFSTFVFLSAIIIIICNRISFSTFNDYIPFLIVFGSALIISLVSFPFIKKYKNNNYKHYLGLTFFDILFKTSILLISIYLTVLKIEFIYLIILSFILQLTAFTLNFINNENEKKSLAITKYICIVASQLIIILFIFLF